MSPRRELLLVALVTVTAALGWLAVQVLLHQAGSQVTFWQRLPLAGVEPLAGHAYVAPLAGRAVYRRYPQDPKFFQLLEDGRPLPRPGASGGAVRRHGAGRYLLRPGGVQFAASDSSDPRHNGRRYELRCPRPAPPAAVAAAYGGAAAGTLLCLLLARGELRRRWPVMKRAATPGLLVLVAWIGMAVLLGAWLPPPPDPQLDAKLHHLAAHGDDYDVLFLGSSLFYHQIMPEEFDRTLAARGQELRSFNLGVPGMPALEACSLARQVLGRRPARLRWLVVDTQRLDFGVEPGNRDSARVIRWHDPATTVLAWRAIARAGLPPAERAAQLWSHLGPAAARASNLGRGRDGLAAWLAGEPAPADGLWSLGPRRDGFVSLDLELRARSSSELRRLQREFQAGVEGYRQRLRRFARRPGGATAAPPAELFQLLQLRDLARRHGVEPVFVDSPVLESRPWLQAAAERGELALLAFNDPRRYPQLFAPALRFDAGHLNAAGAQVYSRLLAERFAELASTAGGGR